MVVNHTYNEAAHRIVLQMFDLLDATERRLAHAENAQAVANLAALKVRIDSALTSLRTPTNNPSDPGSSCASSLRG